MFTVYKLGGQPLFFTKGLALEFPALLQIGIWDTNLQMSICGSV